MEDRVRDFIIFFVSILYEALPFIVLGATIAGFLEELVPQRYVTRLIPRSRTLAIALSGLLGLVFPMCECGIIPVMRRLLRKGLPLSCCVAYMLAGPIINVVVMLSTYVAFAPHKPEMMGGPWMVLFRCGVGYLVALGTALVVERTYRKHGAAALLTPAALPDLKKSDEDEEADEARKRSRPWRERLGNISETALHDFVDITVFLILGALLAAASRQFLSHDDIENLSHQFPLLSILSMMGLAVVLCLCSEADAFVAASFTLLRPSAKLAFLVLGPMLDFKLYLMYTRIYRPRLIWTIITSVVVQVLLYCLVIHFIWDTYVNPPAKSDSPTPAATAGP